MAGFSFRRGRGMTLLRDSVCLSLFSPLSSSSMSFTWGIRCDGSVRLNKLKGTQLPIHCLH